MQQSTFTNSPNQDHLERRPIPGACRCPAPRLHRKLREQAPAKKSGGKPRANNASSKHRHRVWSSHIGVHQNPSVAKNLSLFIPCILCVPWLIYFQALLFRRSGSPPNAGMTVWSGGQPHAFQIIFSAFTE
jgi:hypothetical protein